MSADQDGGKPGATGPGVGRPPAETPARIQIRHEASTPGESAVISAADTAMALARDVGSSQAGHAQTEAGDGRSSKTGSGRVRASFDDPEPPQLESLVGTTLSGRYQITRKIGQGGMGAVFEATHTLIGKRVAVKVLLDKYARREAIVARLEQEARLASSIGHEHIIDINDFGTTEDGRTFVVMEFLEGESLAECLAREGQLPEQRILRIAYQIASALGAAHAKGIVHRDVKPENVFLLKRKEQDFVKVVDFGISKSLRASDASREEEHVRLTQTGMVLGTPLYMSPEQARGDENLDHRIDVYAVGVIMYELATGRVPFMGTNYLSVISQVLNDEPRSPRSLRPDISEEFEAIVLKALEKDKESRYQSTEEMIGDLSALLDDPTHSTERARITGPRRRKLLDRRAGGRTMMFIGGAAIVAAAAVVAVVLMMRGPERAAAVVAGQDARGAVSGLAPDAAPAGQDAKVAGEMITFEIVSTPEGATVYEGSRKLGKTPYKYLAPLNDDKITLIAHLDGYDDAEFFLIPTVDKIRAPDGVITVPMNRPRKGTTPVNKIKRPGNGTGSGDGGGDGAGTGAAKTDLGHNPYPTNAPAPKRDAGGDDRRNK
jgi:eukaryotic-like serine/threonine-protein kinase